MSYVQDAGHEWVNCFVIFSVEPGNCFYVFKISTLLLARCRARFKYRLETWRRTRSWRKVDTSSRVHFSRIPPISPSVFVVAKREIQKSRAVVGPIVVVVGKHSRARRHWFRAQNASGRGDLLVRVREKYVSKAASRRRMMDNDDP